MSERVHVKIFNQTYSLRSGSDAEHIQRVAQIVDERMRQISAHTETFDLARVAVLAALNIADELQRMKEGYQDERRTLESQPAPPAPAKTTGQSEASNDSESRKNDEPQSWFEAIFDDDEPVKERRERLSSQVSAKLQSIRPSESESMSLTVEEGK